MAITGAVAALSAVFAACTPESAAPTAPGVSPVPTPDGVPPSPTPTAAAGAGPAIPQDLRVIPDSYRAPAQAHGTLTELSYDTYESKSYDQQTQKLTKRAIVYLPHSYDPSERYNVFYLMHGGWSNETTTLGTAGDPSE